MTVTFSDLEAAAPSLGRFLRQRIEATGLCFLGTIRDDGGPRVSPIELFLADGRLYVGSMPNAVKVRDLRRDPRCCLVTPLADKDDMSGEGKLFCRAREVVDPAVWEQVRKRFLEERGFDMGEPGGSHLFELEIEGGAHQRVEGDDFRTTSWHEGGPRRERSRTGPLGESVDLT
jgi:general stress protein 26